MISDLPQKLMRQYDGRCVIQKNALFHFLTQEKFAKVNLKLNILEDKTCYSLPTYMGCGVSKESSRVFNDLCETSEISCIETCKPLRCCPPCKTKCIMYNNCCKPKEKTCHCNSLAVACQSKPSVKTSCCNPCCKVKQCPEKDETECCCCIKKSIKPAEGCNCKEVCKCTPEVEWSNCKICVNPPNEKDCCPCCRIVKSKSTLETKCCSCIKEVKKCIAPDKERNCCTISKILKKICTAEEEADSSPDYCIICKKCKKSTETKEQYCTCITKEPEKLEYCSCATQNKQGRIEQEIENCTTCDKVIIRNKSGGVMRTEVEYCTNCRKTKRCNEVKNELDYCTCVSTVIRNVEPQKPLEYCSICKKVKRNIELEDAAEYCTCSTKIKRCAPSKEKCDHCIIINDKYNNAYIDQVEKWGRRCVEVMNEIKDTLIEYKSNQYDDEHPTKQYYQNSNEKFYDPPRIAEPSRSTLDYVNHLEKWGNECAEVLKLAAEKVEKTRCRCRHNKFHSSNRSPRLKPGILKSSDSLPIITD